MSSSISSSIRQPLHAAGGAGQARAPDCHDARAAGAEGIDKLNVARSDIPAVTHVDYSARIQTVHPSTNERFYRLLSKDAATYGQQRACQHELQRARRADRLHAGGCLSLLHGDRDGPARSSATPFCASRISFLPCRPPCSGDALIPDAAYGLPAGARHGDVLARADRWRLPMQPRPHSIRIAKVCRPCWPRSRPRSGDPHHRQIKASTRSIHFPSYDGVQEFGDLVNRERRLLHDRELLDAIGFNKLVLECGCGTGQLSHFLSLNNNHVLGIDLSLSSLKLAVEHKPATKFRAQALSR